MSMISVIVPTLNEAGRIQGCLEQFQSQPGAWELIVVDGGSTDGTVQLAKRSGARVLASPPGRGPQQNAGAAMASGDVLLFLHADAHLPPDAHRQVLSALSEPGVAAGAFRIRHQPERWASTWKSGLLRLADFRSHRTKRPYGDQGIFLRKSVFEAVGGFPQRPLMEEIPLVRRLAQRGTIRILKAEIQVSGRRFESGLLHAFFCMNTFPWLDRMGVPPGLLVRLYGNPR